MFFIIKYNEMFIQQPYFSIETMGAWGKITQTILELMNLISSKTILMINFFIIYIKLYY